MGDQLITIYCSEDGDKSISFTTKAEFMKKIEEDYIRYDCKMPRFAQPVEKINMDHFSGYILIEGNVIVPKPVEKVTKYEF